MAKFRRPAYTKYACYRTRANALREAARLRKSGRYNAKVLSNKGSTKAYYPWATWSQLKTDKP